MAVKRGVFREAVLQQDLQVGTKLAKKRKIRLRESFFLHFGALPQSPSIGYLIAWKTKE
ncbi:hypothetical protein MYY11_002821 [Enterococcus faecium]|nr:hypothetical protein [Enterococcus faecium]